MCIDVACSYLRHKWPWRTSINFRLRLMLQTNVQRKSQTLVGNLLCHSAPTHAAVRGEHTRNNSRLFCTYPIDVAFADPIPLCIPANALLICVLGTATQGQPASSRRYSRWNDDCPQFWDCRFEYVYAAALRCTALHGQSTVQHARNLVPNDRYSIRR